jgi:hypothetical protein
MFMTVNRFSPLTTDENTVIEEQLKSPRTNENNTLDFFCQESYMLRLKIEEVKKCQ